MPLYLPSYLIFSAYLLHKSSLQCITSFVHPSLRVSVIIIVCDITSPIWSVPSAFLFLVHCHHYLFPFGEFKNNKASLTNVCHCPRWLFSLNRAVELLREGTLRSCVGQLIFWPGIEGVLKVAEFDGLLDQVFGSVSALTHAVIQSSWSCWITELRKTAGLVEELKSWWWSRET